MKMNDTAWEAELFDPLPGCIPAFSFNLVYCERKQRENLEIQNPEKSNNKAWGANFSEKYFRIEYQLFY